MALDLRDYFKVFLICEFLLFSYLKNSVLCEIKASLYSRPPNGGFKWRLKKNFSGKLLVNKLPIFRDSQFTSKKRWQLIWADFLRSWHEKVGKALRKKADFKSYKTIFKLSVKEVKVAICSYLTPKSVKLHTFLLQLAQTLDEGACSVPPYHLALGAAFVKFWCGCNGSSAVIFLYMI